MRLPEGVDASAIEASFDRGALEVTVPKPAPAQPHTIPVTVGDAPNAIATETAEPTVAAE